MLQALHYCAAGAGVKQARCSHWESSRQAEEWNYIGIKDIKHANFIMRMQQDSVRKRPCCHSPNSVCLYAGGKKKVQALPLLSLPPGNVERLADPEGLHMLLQVRACLCLAACNKNQDREQCIPQGLCHHAALLLWQMHP